MNSDSPPNPRDELEARLTALLLGELSAEEAAIVHRAIEKDVELARLHERLKRTIDLVREAAANPIEQVSPQSAPLRLSEERRQRLLERFKTAAPMEFAAPRRREMPWFIPMSVAAGLVALIGSVALLPRFAKSSMKAKAHPQRIASLQLEDRAGLFESDSRKELLLANDQPSLESIRSRESARQSAQGLGDRPGVELRAQTDKNGDGVASNREQRDSSILSRTVSDEATPTAFGISGIVLPSAIVPEGTVTAELASKPSPATPSGFGGGFGGGGGGGGIGGGGGLGGSAGMLAPAVTYPSTLAVAGVPTPDFSAPPPGQTLTVTASSSDQGSTAKALPQSTAPPMVDINFIHEAGKLGFQGGTAPSFSAPEQAVPQRAYELAPSPPNAFLDRFAFLNSSEKQPESGIVASPDGSAVESLARELAVPSIRAPQAPTPEQVFAENAPPQIRLDRDPIQLLGSSKDLNRDGNPIVFQDNQRGNLAAWSANGVALNSTLKQTDNKELSRIAAPDAPKRSDGDPSRPALASRGEKEAAPPQMDPVLMMRYGLLRPGVLGVDSKSKTAVTAVAGSGPEPRQQSIVLPSAESAPTVATITATSDNTRALQEKKRELDELVRLKDNQRESSNQPADISPAKPTAPAAVPQPEVQTHDNVFSTFSLNVSDVSFKLAAASLEKGVMPEPATVRSEEFINAFDYRDSEPPPGVPIAFAWERVRYPFAHNRDLLRFSVKTAAEGRQPGRSLNLVLLLDNSGSMERADRARIVRQALRVLAGQLQPQDKLSVIAFARTARLWADGVAGTQAGQVVEQVSNLTPQGGTNLEDAMNLAYQTALRHYVHGGVNRVVLLTDGAANLGNANPDALKQVVEAHRKQGIALDCFGIGWEGYNDDLLEVLSRNGDGRYGFINTPEEAATGFANQLAGALRVAASDVKVQVEFNPKRIIAYRQIGYARHQLTQEQFRDNTVDAAEIGAAESGNALYVVEGNPRGDDLLAVVRVRYKLPGTVEYHEHEWIVPYTGNAVPLEQASSAMRLAATASAFSEWLVSSPYAAEVTPDRLLAYLSGVPEVYGIDPRPKQLESMIRQAKSAAGR